MKLGGVLAAPMLAVLLSGCFAADAPTTLADRGFVASGDAHTPLAAADLDWPDFSGRTLDILDHGAFEFAFGPAAERFAQLTGATVRHFGAADTGTALNQAIAERGRPTFDVFYGIDNALLLRAMQAQVLDPYTPQLADRVAPQYVFFDTDATGGIWPATPVDHGTIALNIDRDGPGMEGVDIEDLFDLRAHANTFVTQDPRTSTPGLGFLLITVAVFGEGGPYDWQDYWRELFAGGVRVTPGWSEAYVTHFSGGYGIYEAGHIGDRAIVTSYSESPAVEVYFGSFGPEDRADVLLDHRGHAAAFRQVQTMAVLRGTADLDLAQAWIEFTLTDDFQELAAPYSAVYPVIPVVDHNATYGDLDPEPGTFDTVDLDWRTIGEELGRWLAQWTALCEAHRCA